MINRSARGAFHFAKEPGCSCSLLSDNADWSSPTWELAADVLEGLAKAVAVIADEAGGLEFNASWMGEEPLTRTPGTLDELVADIRANRIRNHHAYIVGGGARGGA
jgi:hypothetical protein